MCWVRMAPEAALSIKDKKKLKWERKQGKLKAAAEARGETYTPPEPKADSKLDKVAKRKAKKLNKMKQAAQNGVEKLSAAGAAQPATPDAVPADAEAADSMKGETKKRKRKEAEAAAVAAGNQTDTSSEPVSEATIVELPASDGANAADKTQPVSKKSKKAAKQAAAAAAAPDPANGLSIGIDSLTDKQKRKAERKAAKAAAAQHTSNAVETELPSGTGNGTHKHKKAKQQAAATAVSVESQAPAVWAEVGDQELARNGAPVRKQLYTVHADTAALSQAEVEAWQADRCIAVAGADIRPVQQFNQAGRCYLRA